MRYSALDRFRLAVDMLGWSHARLLEFVGENVAAGAFVASAPLPSPLEIELEAEGASVRVLGAPEVTPAEGDPEAAFLAQAIARRASTLAAVLAAGVARSGVHAADVADAASLHESRVEAIVRGKRVRVDGVVLPFEQLVDLDGVVATDRIPPALGAALAPCTETYGLGDASLCEWPNNVLSTRTVVLEGGRIARRGDGSVARYVPAERARCELLAEEAAALVGDLPVGMKSESDAFFSPFYLAAMPDARRPEHVDEAFVRAMFGGSISPFDPVLAEPFDERGTLWADASAGDPERVARLEALRRFFAANDLATPTFVAIGFGDYAPATPMRAADRPAGFESRGSRLPRLIVGFTAAGSAVGLFGDVVWT